MQRDNSIIYIKLLLVLFSTDSHIQQGIKKARRLLLRYKIYNMCKTLEFHMTQ